MAKAGLFHIPEKREEGESIRLPETASVNDGAWYRIEKRNGMVIPVKLDIQQGKMTRTELNVEDAFTISMGILDREIWAEHIRGRQ